MLWKSTYKFLNYPANKLTNPCDRHYPACDAVVSVGAAVRTKKSSCVKEVEKIKQRRTERRAAQLAMREQNGLEYDLTAPSWEFDAMIRYCHLLVYTPIICETATTRARPIWFLIDGGNLHMCSSAALHPPPTVAATCCCIFMYFVVCFEWLIQ